MASSGETGSALASSRCEPIGRAAAEAPIRFVDVTEAMGIHWRHFAGRSLAKEMPETMGGGVAWLDYDNDGRADLYFVDSGPLPGAQPIAVPPERAGENRLYRHRAGAGFGEAPAASAGDPGYGMGVAVGDYDGDGWSDVYVTNYGANVLLRNNGDGTFTDVTRRHDVGGAEWSTSSAWSDLDLDGFPELYVANYVSYQVPSRQTCTGVGERRIYCTPDLFDGVADDLYSNHGGAGFVNVAASSGVANGVDGKGLGVVIVDLDLDGLADIYVANDATRNFLYMNRGELRFDDLGLLSGTGVSAEGYPQSGMGVDIADLDGDGVAEIGVTNFERQAVNLYKAVVPGLFQDQTFTLGIGEATVMTLGFGLVFTDFDGDGDLDVAIANGHLDYDATSAQPNQVFRNLHVDLGQPASPTGGSLAATAVGLLVDVTAQSVAGAAVPKVSRGLATGDLEGDGWPDVVITNVEDTPAVLRNQAPRTAQRLVLRLRGRGGNRDGYGARVEITPVTGTGGGRMQYFDVKSSTSYLSQGTNELYVGLDAVARARVVVRWPGGADDDLGEIDAGYRYLVRQSMGVVAKRALEPER